MSRVVRLKYGKLLDGLGVFGGGHAGNFFKLSGKIVDRGVTKLVCDLGEGKLPSADEFFCPFDL